MRRTWGKNISFLYNGQDSNDSTICSVGLINLVIIVPTGPTKYLPSRNIWIILSGGISQVVNNVTEGRKMVNI